MVAQRKEAALSVPAWAWAMADELKLDLDRLSKMGVNLDKAAAAAGPIGVGTGLYVAYRVHPLLGVAVAGAGLLAKFATGAWKKAKVEDIQQKWWRKLTSMDQAQLEAFSAAVQIRYPLLAPSGGILLPPGGPVGAALPHGPGEGVFSGHCRQCGGSIAVSVPTDGFYAHCPLCGQRTYVGP